MNLQRLSFLTLISALVPVAIGFIGCTTVRQIDCGNDSFCSTTTGDMIVPNVVAKTEKTISYDFNKIIFAKPVIKVSGLAKAKIKYRIYSNAADAVESVFELPDIDPREQATDLMDSIARITATYESPYARKFRFLDIELSDEVDILRTGAIPISSEASSPHQQSQLSKP